MNIRKFFRFGLCIVAFALISVLSHTAKGAQVTAAADSTANVERIQTNSNITITMPDNLMKQVEPSKQENTAPSKPAQQKNNTANKAPANTNKKKQNTPTATPTPTKPAPKTKDKETAKVSSSGPHQETGFRIQIFSDGRDQRTLADRARTRSNSVIARFPKYRNQVYSFSKAPNYYTRVGNFRTQKEASAALAELRRAFPSFAGEMRIVKSNIIVVD